MESLWKLKYIFQPTPLILIFTSVAVVFISAHGALKKDREARRKEHEEIRKESEPELLTLTLESRHALLIPIASSCSLIFMFYFFSPLSQFITIFMAAATLPSLGSCIWPYAGTLTRWLGQTPGFHAWLVTSISLALFFLWLVSGHWILNNIFAISFCVGFVALTRLPNVKVCTLLLTMLFFYDIFWVFYSEKLFGANVMLTVATQQASNPIRAVADKLKLTVLQSVVSRKLEMPIKILIPANIVGAFWRTPDHFHMLGLGDMAIPGMLMALVLCFDHSKDRLTYADVEPRKQPKYIWIGMAGYTLGIFASFAGGILMQSAQPALLYLVPFTLGPIMLVAWRRGEFAELWDGPRPVVSDKSPLDSV